MSAHSKIIGLTLALCAAPYAGLRWYLALGMHESLSLASVPDSRFLGALFLLGAVVPIAGVGWMLWRALRDRLHFRLSILVAAYLALIVIFASSYAIVQASSVEPSFSGMPLVWAPGDEVTLDVHLGRLHSLFLDSLYLSVMTITTVGYGDIAPLSGIAKTLTAAEGLAGIGFVAIAFGHYFSVCLRGSAGGT